MTDREEKLVELLKETGMLEIEDCLYIAEHLTAHGVTVKEMQKLLKRGTLLTNSPCWIEIRYGDGFFDLEPAEITKGTGANYYIYLIGTETTTRLDGKDYGKWWRCWAEKPTEKERKDAGWHGL